MAEVVFFLQDLSKAATLSPGLLDDPFESFPNTPDEVDENEIEDITDVIETFRPFDAKEAAKKVEPKSNQGKRRRLTKENSLPYNKPSAAVSQDKTPKLMRGASMPYEKPEKMYKASSSKSDVVFKSSKLKPGEDNVSSREALQRVSEEVTVEKREQTEESMLLEKSNASRLAKQDEARDQTVHISDSEKNGSVVKNEKSEKTNKVPSSKIDGSSIKSIKLKTPINRPREAISSSKEALQQISEEEVTEKTDKREPLEDKKLPMLQVNIQPDWKTPKQHETDDQRMGILGTGSTYSTGSEVDTVKTMLEASSLSEGPSLLGEDDNEDYEDDFESASNSRTTTPAVSSRPPSRPSRPNTPVPSSAYYRRQERIREVNGS